MTHAEQHKLIVELMDFAHKMKGRDQEEFGMFVKRDKDDEDLDEISKKKLQHLAEVYIVRKPRPRPAW